ncbi:MAG: type II/IV secretion system ATPase subunit [Desulfurococcales archaeon]|nr:type II/IV secretion system ATPase subunit [Desulfurococcales archaeon]
MIKLRSIRNLLAGRTEEGKAGKARKAETLRLGQPSEEARGESLEFLGGPGTRVIATYRIRAATYTLYVRSGRVRLHVAEPPISGERLEELVLGLDSPRNEGESYLLDKARSGYGPLYPLIIDPHVEEIACEGPGKPLAIIHKLVPDRWVDADIVLDEEEADSLAIQLARLAGKTVSLAAPLAEGLTREGHRVAVTFSREVSRFGSSFIVRKFPSRPITIADLIAQSVISPLEAAYLWLLLEARMFILIIGPMASGKTTLLQALASLIPPFRRVVTIEDTPEIRLPTPHWDALVARPPLPGEDIGEISLEDLLRFALRRRADYIIVGEVRGREARLLSQAVAAGHGGMTTFHADSPEAAIMRLLLDPIDLPRLFLRSIAAIVLIRRMPDYMGGVRRRVVSITEVTNDDELLDVFTWDPHTDTHKPSEPEAVLDASERIKRAWEILGIPHTDPARELAERASFLERHKEDDPESFQEALLRFYNVKYGFR